MDCNWCGSGGASDSRNHCYRRNGGCERYRHFLRTGDLLCHREMVELAQGTRVRDTAGSFTLCRRLNMRSHSRIRHSIVAVLCSGFLSACMVGPKYHRPVVQTPNTFRDLADNPQIKTQSASYADLPWWQVFKDPRLQELIRTALKQNYDLEIATERISAARAQLAVTRSSLFPQVGAGANFNGGKENNFQAKYNFLTLLGDAAFQLEFFGRLRRANEAARAELLATEDARRTVVLTLVSDVANDYFTLLQLDLQLQITHETVATQADSVKLTKLRLEHGVATKLDVLQAQQVLDTANADIPDLERQIAQEENAISILLGNY